jgi:transcriptional regulator with XRE-family HTH domain
MSEKNVIAEVAERFKAERKRVDISHERVGEACGVSGRSVISWEQGVKIPSHCLAILAGHGFDVNYILTGVRTPKPAAAIAEGGAEYRSVSKREARILDLLSDLPDEQVRQVQDAAEKEKQLKELREELAEARRKA